MRYVLAHDVGTTGDKATLFGDDGTLVASAFAPYETLIPHTGWSEQRPGDWWRALCQTTRSLLGRSVINPSDIAAVSFSGQMMGAVAVDIKGDALRNAIIWADLRATEQAAKAGAAVDPNRVYALTGHRLSASYSAAKICWIKEHEPDVYRATSKFLHAKDFLVAKLTGVHATDRSDASGTNLYDLERGEWSEEMLRAFEIDKEFLPDIHESTDVVGQVHAAAADETGLKPGTPVVIGGGDGSCASVGAGAVREAVAYNYIGSSSWIALASARPIFDPEMRTFTWAHLVPGMFSPCGTMQAAGGSYQYARDLLAQHEKVVAEGLGIPTYELMNQELEHSPPGAGGLLFLPYLIGERSPRWNPDARGGFVGLTIRHQRVDLLRAVLEGVTFNLRVILEAFQAQGAGIRSLRVIGGGAHSAVWNQIMADIFQLPIERLALDEEATSTGAAIAGGVGVGLWKDFSMADEMVHVVNETHPRAELAPLYDELYGIFNETYERLEAAGLFRRLAAVGDWWQPEEVDVGRSTRGDRGLLGGGDPSRP